MGFKKKTMNPIWNNSRSKYNLQTYELSDQKSKTNPTQKFSSFSSIYIKITTEPMENEKHESILSLFDFKNFFMLIY